MLATVSIPGCLRRIDSRDCSPLEDGSAPVPEDGKDVDDLAVTNRRSDDATVQLAIDGPDARRCGSPTLEPDETVGYQHVFADGVEYTVDVRVDGQPLWGETYDWRPERLDNRGLIVVVGDDGIAFEPYEH